MKNLLMIIALLMAHISFGQRNELTESEFFNIKIIGKTLKSIMATEGKPGAMTELFGEPLSTNIENDEKNPYSAKFYYKGLKMNFHSYGRKTKLMGFEITTYSARLKVKDVTVRVGDNISKLGSVVFNTQTTGDKSIKYVVKDWDGPFLIIEFDQTTKLITRMYYFELT